MKLNRFFSIFMLSVILICSVSSCVSVVKQSKIVSKDIRVKMTKQEVKYRIGSPYKVASKLSNSGRYYDYWYYKENIYTGNSWYWIETILIFDKDTLFEIKQGKERKEGTTIQIEN